MKFEHYKEVTTLPIIGTGVEFSCMIQEAVAIRVDIEQLGDISEVEIRERLEMSLTNKLKQDLLKTQDFHDIRLSANEVDIVVEALYNQRMLTEQSLHHNPNIINGQKMNETNGLFDRFTKMEMEMEIIRNTR